MKRPEVCCGQSLTGSSDANPFTTFANHRELLRSQGYDGPLQPLSPSGQPNALLMFVGSGPGQFERKKSARDHEPASWRYNRLVRMEYSLGGRIGWQLASCMAEVYRSLEMPLPDEIQRYFPRFKTGPRDDPELTDTAVRTAQKFFPAWYTNAVKCHEGSTYTSADTRAAMNQCVDCYLKEEIRLIKPRYVFTLGKKAIPALQQLTGISHIDLGDMREVEFSGHRANWFAWWHNPQFNAHKTEFVQELRRIFRSDLSSTT